jgi:hypothetical protein
MSRVRFFMAHDSGEDRLERLGSQSLLILSGQEEEEKEKKGNS